MSEDDFIGGLNRRLRLMLRHTWLLGIAAILLLVGVAAVTAYVVNRPTTLKIAVGPAGGDDTRLVHAIAQHLARDGAGIRLQIVGKDGSAEAAAAVDSGEADLAVVRGDMAPKNGQAVVILRRNHLVLFVPAAGSAAASAVNARSKQKGKAAKKKTIEKIGDLAGNRLGVIGRSQANITLLNTVLRQYNVPPDKVTVTQLSSNELGAALRAGQFDVLMTVGPTSSPITAEAVSLASHDKKGPTFLAVDASEAIAQRVPIYESTEIPAGAFGGSPPRPEETVETVGFPHYIVARKDVSESTVGDFAKLVFGARQSLAVDMPATSKIEAPATDKDATVAVHPGAVAYIDGEQKTFFDKYSELLYWGLFALSMLGSAAAGLASYAKAGDRIDKLGMLDRLMELIGVARGAASLGQLDELQSEVDGILKTTIQAVEKGGLEESGLTAFSLALEQTRQAISDRRALLLAGTASA
jgi:TRAP-type uncharacterized transport system substrate-binding protein